MFVIFGWGHQTERNFGQALPVRCPNCHNNVFWHLVNFKVWFTLFFISAISYESKYYLLCEVCSHGVELKRHEVEKARHLNQISLDFMNKNIDQQQYITILNESRMLM